MLWLYAIIKSFLKLISHGPPSLYILVSWCRTKQQKTDRKLALYFIWTNLYLTWGLGQNKSDLPAWGVHGSHDLNGAFGRIWHRTAKVSKIIYILSLKYVALLTKIIFICCIFDPMVINAKIISSLLLPTQWKGAFKPPMLIWFTSPAHHNPNTQIHIHYSHQ